MYSIVGGGVVLLFSKYIMYSSWYLCASVAHWMIVSFFLFRAIWEGLWWTVSHLLGSEIPVPAVKQRRILLICTNTFGSHRFGKGCECFSQRVMFPNSLNLSMFMWGSGKTWMWTAGRSGWSLPKAPRRRRVQKRAACCGSKTTSRAFPWRVTELVELNVT